MSKSLRRGKKYAFKVEAVIERDGKDITLQKEIVLTAGRQSRVKFDFDKPVLTQLTVKVPENAKIELCGYKTEATGSVRNFRTQLMPGKKWDNYDVLVSYEKDGKIWQKQKTLSIAAGQDQVVDFLNLKDYYVKK